MKKILFILPALTVGGLERVQVTLANKLSRNGYDVTVMTLGKGDDLRWELDEKVHFVYKPLKTHPIMGRIPYIRNRFYDDGMWETRATPEQLHRYYIGDEHYDVEIGFFRGLPIKIVSGGTPDKSVRHLAWVHNDFSKATGFCNNFKSIAEVRKAYASYDRVVCVSEQAKEGFIAQIGDTGNLVSVYNMIPVEETRQKALESPNVVANKADFHMVVVARLLDSAKGQIRLIDVISRLHNEGKSVSLCLVGGGPDEQSLKDEIEKQGASGYITMVGSQVNPYPYIQESDLLVCSSYFEGYNLTVAEAMILGIPVLSTDCAGPREILDGGKYGMLVENSEAGLYEGIKKLADSPSLREHYRQLAVERREFFDEEKILKQIIDLF